jgi:hypothetical protein
VKGTSLNDAEQEVCLPPDRVRNDRSHNIRYFQKDNLPVEELNRPVVFGLLD